MKNHLLISFIIKSVLLFILLKINGKNTIKADFSGNINYSGENFPKRYLSLDIMKSSIVDLYHYYSILNRVLSYFGNHVNQTDANVAIGMYFTKGILKRSLKDYNHKIKELRDLEPITKRIINEAENVLSHFRYNIKIPTNFRLDEKMKMKIGQIFQYDESLVYSIEDFNKGRLSKWLFSSSKLYDHINDFDTGIYPRYDYVKLIAAMEDYYLIDKSDECIANVTLNPEPIRMEPMRPCRPDPVCRDAALDTPAFAYLLTHRLLVLLTRNLMKRCYVLSSPEMDKMYMDIMCAAVYRETVYLARRGFFARDLFLEQIALCGLYGYEEFHRRSWFVKAASWVDDDGCVMENYNCRLNLTKIRLQKHTNQKYFKRLKAKKYKELRNECQTHPMALMAITLAHGIRHSLHYITDSMIQSVEYV